MKRQIWPGILMALVLSGCKEPESLPDPCNPEAGRFIDEEHYIGADLLHDKTHWNMNSWLRYQNHEEKFRPNTLCIPIETEASFEQRLMELEATTDIQR